MQKNAVQKHITMNFADAPTFNKCEFMLYYL